MGLASALSTALTGMSAAETTIDVVGNNLANSNTVGFKASEANFATQFLQTQSLGSAPTEGTGGTNPRQVGLGALVSDISPDFSQGTIQISSTPTDLAIQGDGFFVVEGSEGELYYTRNGIMKLNSANEITTMTGNRLMGYMANQDYQIERTQMVPLSIPLGKAAVAAATKNVAMEGTFSPSGNVATQGEIIQSAILTDGAYGTRPAQCEYILATTPTQGANGGASSGANAGGIFQDGQDYNYRVVFADKVYLENDANPTYTEGVDSGGTGTAVTVTAGSNYDQIDLDLTTSVANIGKFDVIQVYRSHVNDASGTYYHVGTHDPASGNTFSDTVADADLGTGTHVALDDSTPKPDGPYTYYYTFYNAGTNMESKPSETNALTVTAENQKVHITDIPDPGADWTHVKLYRSLASQTSNWYEVAMLKTEGLTGADLPTAYTDNLSDADINDTDNMLSFDGPYIKMSTLLTDIQLETKSLTIDGATNVSQLLTFMQDAMGIQNIVGQDAGGGITQSMLQLKGNYGTDNAIEIKLSSFLFVPTGEIVGQTINLPFTTEQDANGESAVTDFLAYDSLGIPCSVRVTAVMEEKTNTKMTWRWFGDSPDNSEIDPADPSIAVGTGTITFNSEGKVVAVDGETISIDRNQEPSASPLSFDIDFTEVVGLQTERSVLATSRQDGSPPGILTSFIIGEEGTIRGVFSNGITRDIGQIELARFANPNGLEQTGQNLFVSGVNSGLPIYNDPGNSGLGKIVAGAVELSNTDVGGNLIDLILASTMYRSNTRVISTTQNLFDELVMLGR